MNHRCLRFPIQACSHAHEQRRARPPLARVILGGVHGGAAGEPGLILASASADKSRDREPADVLK